MAQPKTSRSSSKKSASRYDVHLSDNVARHLDKIDPMVRAQLLLHIFELAVDPRPTTASFIDPDEEVYSLRFGGIRIVYWIQNTRTVVILFIVADDRKAR